MLKPARGLALWTLCAVLWLLLGLRAPATALAADAPAGSSEAQGADAPLTVMTSDWEPYVSPRMGGLGFAAEVVSYAFLHEGLEVAFRFAPWTRCELMVKNGEAFAAMPYAKTPKRETFALFSDPMCESREVFFYRKDRLNFRYTGLDSLRGLRVGGTAGYYYVDLFAEAGLENVEYAHDEEASIRKLYLGRVDVAPNNEFVGWSLIRALYPGESHLFASTTEHLASKELRLMVSRQYPGALGLVEDFNRGLAAIRGSGLYDRLLARYRLAN